MPASPWDISAFLAPRDAEAASALLAGVRDLRSRILYDHGRRPMFRELDAQPQDFGAWHFVARREAGGPPLGYVRLATPATGEVFQSREFLGARQYAELLEAEGLDPGGVFEHSRLVVEHRARKLGLGLHLNAMAVAAAHELGAAAMIGTSGTADGQDRFHQRFGFRAVPGTRRYIERYTEDVVIMLHRVAEGAGEYSDLVADYRRVFAELVMAEPAPSAAPPAGRQGTEGTRPVLAADPAVSRPPAGPDPARDGSPRDRAASSPAHRIPAQSGSHGDPAAGWSWPSGPGGPSKSRTAASRAPRLVLPSPHPADRHRWKPVLFTPTAEGDRAALAALSRSGAVRELCDTLPSQLEELVTSREPALARDREARREALADQLAGVDPQDYGAWVWYPWSGRLVHVLPREEFRLVRTDRNRNKIDRPDQRRLLGKRIGVVGLSVGSSAALTLAQEGVGGAFRLADFDSLGLSNLNRLRAGVQDLGVAKTVIAARQMFEIDPYLDIEIFPHGLTAGTMAAFFGTADTALDLLVEECDTPWVKLAAREKARELRVPVVMDCNDRGLLDIERFDLEPLRPLLHGRLGTLTSADLVDLSGQERVSLILDMVDREQISPALSDAVGELGRSLSSWPQLASGVALGGALVVESARRILLGRRCESGRFYIDLERLIAPEYDVAV